MALVAGKVLAGWAAQFTTPAANKTKNAASNALPLVLQSGFKIIARTKSD
jgi:hypothetical protein